MPNDKVLWIDAFRDAARKYRVAAPGLFRPNQCPVCTTAYSINEDWSDRCNACIFYKFKCHYQDSFQNAHTAYKESTFYDETDVDDNTQETLIIRAEELENLADNIETIPDEMFPEWVEFFNSQYDDEYITD